MNEKAPEVTERISKRKCLRMGRSSKKVARRTGAEMMWPSGGGSRTCNHTGSNFGTVAAALVQTVARSAREEPQESGGRAHGRKYAACLQGCRLAESLVECWQVPKTPFDQQVAHVANDSTLSSTPACDSTLSSKIVVGAMRMDVSSTQATLRIRVATESSEDSTLSIQRNQSAGGEPRRRSAEREGSHASNDDNPLG